jgi:hypothetical protein
VLAANQAIDAAIATIERQFGKGAIMRYGDTDLSRGATLVKTSTSVSRSGEALAGSRGHRRIDGHCKG